MRFRCLIIDEMHDSIHDLLKPLPLDVDYRPTIKKDELLSIIAHYEILFVRSKIFFDASVFDAATHLKIIARAGAGVDNIDEVELNKRNIILINAPEGNRDAVGEHATGMILSLLNNFWRGHKEIEQGLWLREENRGYELSNKTVGLLGYGFMGAATAKRLKGFGCKIIAYDKYKKGYADAYVEEVDEQTFFNETEIFSVHIPLTKENKFILDESYFNRFKKNIIFINTRRRELVKLKTVADLLSSGKITSAAMDVLENEKLNTYTDEQKKYFQELLKNPNVLLTPHIGGWTHESYRKINEVLVAKLKKII